MVALFLALSGSVVAATTKLTKNSVGSGEIKNKSIKGGDIGDDAVTGSQVNESSLGVVPRAATAGTAAAAGVARTADRAASAGSADRAGSAATADRAATAGTADRAGSAGTADRAGSAATADRATSAATADRAASAGSADRASDSDKLGGRVAGDFARSDQTFAVAAKMDASGAPRVLVERDGVRLVARCVTDRPTATGGTADVLSIYAEADAEGATLMYPKLELEQPVTIGPSTLEATRLVLQQQANVGARAVRFPVRGITLTSARGTTIFFGAPGSLRVSFNMHGGTCAVTAPVVISTL